MMNIYFNHWSLFWYLLFEFILQAGQWLYVWLKGQRTSFFYISLCNLYLYLYIYVSILAKSSNEYSVAFLGWYSFIDDILVNYEIMQKFTIASYREHIFLLN